MKILVVDDHGLFRAGLRLLITSVRQDAQVLEAATLPEALALARQHTDLALCLLDLALDGELGTESLAAIKSASPDVPVAVVSAAHDRSTIQACLDAGAMSFMPKSLRPDTLTQALQRVLEGQVYLPPDAMPFARASPPGATPDP